MNTWDTSFPARPSRTTLRSAVALLEKARDMDRGGVLPSSVLMGAWVWLGGEPLNGAFVLALRAVCDSLVGVDGEWSGVPWDRAIALVETLRAGSTR